MYKNNKNINTVIWLILAAIAFVPLLVNGNTNYPFITAKTFAFRILIISIFVILLWKLFNGNTNRLVIFNIKQNKILGAWILLLIAFGLSAIFGVDSYNSFWSGNERMMGIISWLSFLVFYITLVWLFNIDKNKERAFKHLVLIGAGIVSISAILGYFGGFLLESLRGARLTGLAGNPSYLAVYMLFASFLALSLAFEEHEKGNSHGFAFGLLGFLYFSIILFGTGTRGAMLGWGFGSLGVLTYLIFKYKKNWVGKTSLAIVILGIITVGTLFSLKNTNFVKKNLALSRLTSISVSDLTAQSRLFSYKTAINGWKEKPIFGWGLENYKPAFLHNFIPDMVNNNPDDITFDRVHNMPLEILTTAGIVGFIAYLYFFYSIFISLKEKINRDEINRTAAFILGFGVVGYFISNLFLFDVFESLFMLTIFLAIFTPQLSIKNNPNQIQNIKIQKVKIVILVTISVLSVFVIYKTVILPYNISSNFSKIKTELDKKQYEQAYTRLVQTLASEAFTSRDDIGSFIQVYIKTRELLDAQDKIRFDAALKNNLEILIKRHPSFQDLRVDLSYLLINRPDASAKDIDEAKQLSIGLAQYAPNYVNYRTNLAFIYGLTKDYDKAMGEVNYILAITDKIAAPYWFKGIILNMQGKPQDALDNFYKAIIRGYQPDGEEMSSLVELALKYNDYKYLPTFYRATIQLDPKNIQLYASLAAAYQKIGDYDNARITAQKMLALDPAVKPQVDAFLKTLPATQ